MGKIKTLSRLLIPCLLSGIGFFLMLCFVPDIKKPSFDELEFENITTSYINKESAATIDLLSLLDDEPIFLPTDLNQKAVAPREINIDSFENINNYTSYSTNSYTNYVLSKKELNFDRINNLFYFNIKAFTPYYQVEDKRDFLPRKDSINLSLIEVESGEHIISENVEIKDFDMLSKFFVPTEVFMSVAPDLSINIADNISSSTVNESTTSLIRQVLDQANIFQKINSGYYKIIISP